MTIRTLADNMRHLPILFIVGPPRSGSTLLFQLLTDRYRVSYPAKLWCRLARTPLGGGLARIACALAQRRQRGHGYRHSSYGQVVTGGPLAPAECGTLFHRDLPIGRSESGKTVKPLRSLPRDLRDLARVSDLPVVAKKLVVGNWLRSVTTAFPEAIFVHIHRDPFFNAQSILLARRERTLPFTTDWGPVPRSDRPTERAGEPFLAAWQVIGMNQQIQADLRAYVAPERRYTVQYESMLTAPEETLRAIAEGARGLRPREPQGSLGEFASGNRLRLSESDARDLRTALDALAGAPSR